MKYCLSGIAAAVFILGMAVCLTYTGAEDKEKRVHQHLASRTDTGCDCDGSGLCTHLPLVVIDTKGQRIPGSISGISDAFGQAVYQNADDGRNVIDVELWVIDHQNANNHPSDNPVFTTSCEFRLRGNSSRRFPKPSYALRFTDGQGVSRDLPVMGMPAHHDWILNGPILDKSLVRNYMWYNLSGEVMNYAPNLRFCELIVDGSYEGLYLMAESITAGDDCRLKLSLNVKNSQGTGYLLRCDRPTVEGLYMPRNIDSYTERSLQFYENIEIRYPGREKLTEELARAIELDYSAFEKTLYSLDYTEYDKWIDVGQFVDYYLINEFTGNIDAGTYSTYLYKEVGEPFGLCVWDFNNSCDNYQEAELGFRGFFMQQKLWFFMLLKDETFVERVLERYGELRKTFFNQEYLMDYIDRTLAYLGPAVERNNRRWADEIAGWNTLEPGERAVTSHEDGVRQLKQWLTLRGEWLDENIHTLRQYAHPSRNRAYYR